MSDSAPAASIGTSPCLRLQAGLSRQIPFPLIFITGSMNAGMKTMTNSMSSILNLGSSLEQVIAMSTWNPARQIKMPAIWAIWIRALKRISPSSMLRRVSSVSSTPLEQ